MAMVVPVTNVVRVAMTENISDDDEDNDDIDDEDIDDDDAMINNGGW